MSATQGGLCVCGSSGTGKSHFCEALGQAAVEAGMTVVLFTIEVLSVLVRRHRADDSVMTGCRTTPTSWSTKATAPGSPRPPPAGSDDVELTSPVPITGII